MSSVAQLGQPVDADREGRAHATDVDLDAPVGRAGDEHGVRVLGQQGRAPRRGRRGGRRCPSVRPAGCAAGGRRGSQPRGIRVVVGGLAEGVGGVADGAVAGAAAQVAATGRAGRTRWARARGRAASAGLVRRGGRPWPFWEGSGRGSRTGAPALAVVLGRHAADEARRAVAALRPTAHRHLVLHRVEGVGAAEALGGDDLLAVECRRRHQARVDGGPLRARRPRSGRATMIEQAPHSPSAHPSLAPVRPCDRAASRASWCSGRCHRVRRAHR